MYVKFFTALLFVLGTCTNVFAQFHNFSGLVADSSLSPIPLVEIYLKEGQKIAETDNLGQYECQLLPGNYTVIFSHNEYKSFQLNVTIEAAPDTANVILQNEIARMGQIKMYSKRVDMGPEFMKKAIAQRNFWEKRQPNHSVNIYVKAFEDNFGKKKKVKPVKMDEELDPDVIARKKREQEEAKFMRNKSFAEVVINKDFAQPNLRKEKRTGVKKIGDTYGLFYLSTFDGDFNFYQNLVRIPALNKLPVLSPLANTALLAYKFSFTGSFTDSALGRILTISVKPRLTSNSVFEGEIQLVDTSFAIYRVNLKFPKNQLNEYSGFSIDQTYSFYPDSLWTIAHQRFDYYTKAGKAKYIGYSNVVYKDYEINKIFPKRHFNLELGSTSQGAYEKDSAFWEGTRAVLLNPIESMFIQKSDSAKRARESDWYLDSIEDKTNKVTLSSLFLDGQEYSNRKRGLDLFFVPLITVYQPWWPGGDRFSIINTIRKEFKNKKWFRLVENLNYGYRNKDLQGNIRFLTRYDPFKQGFISVNMGREFSFINQNAAFIDLARRDNVYRHEHITVYHRQEYLNGLVGRVEASYSNRSDISNVKLSPDGLADSLFENNIVLPFASNRAFYANFRLSYTPAQKYLREPKEKIIIGSRWPTFYVDFKKAIPGVFNSDIDFEFLDFGIKQEVSLGMLGFSQYNLKMGSFLRNKNVSPVDYKYQRRGDIFVFTNPMYAFQTLDSTFNTFGKFLEGHYRHRFEGALLNKIPFVKKLRMRETAGGSILVAPERRNMFFGELYAGIDKIIRIRKQLFKLGVYYAVGYSNIFDKPNYGFKLNLEFYDRVDNSW